MKTYLVLFIFLCFARTIDASSIDGKTISMDDLFQAIMSDETDAYSNVTIGSPVAYYSTDGFIRFDKCNIVFDREKDNKWDLRFANGGEKIVIKKGIDFNGCNFPEEYWFTLRNFVFEGPVSFIDVKGLNIFLKECQFKNNFSLRGCEMQFGQFEECQFGLGWEVSGNSIIQDHLTLKKCTFSYREDFYTSPIVRADQNMLGNLLAIPSYFLIQNRNNPFFLNILNCEFIVPKALENKDNITLDVSNSIFNGLEMSMCNLNVPINFSLVTISNQFKFSDIKTNSLFLAEAISFNPANSKLDWGQIAGRKIAIKGNKGELISGKTASSIENDIYFNTLISVYALIYNSYKAQGNKMASNACYIEWKDIETEYFAHVLVEKPDTNKLFLWVMNQFLKTFCDYGTNPIRSMTWSFIVMFCFGLVYLFFPNSMESRSERSYFNKVRSLMKYFTENKRLSECITDSRGYSSSLSNSERLIKELKKHDAVVPFYFKIAATPLGSGNKMMRYYKFKLLSKIDAFTGRWNELSRLKGFFVYFFYAFILFISLSYLVLIKITRAMMLSLNAFSTLGFGDVPVTGFAKYLAIIEGFMGWFLLSIFSVALLSQIIQ